MNWVTRITLTIVLLSGAAYLAYVKTRSTAVTPAVPSQQPQSQQQQKVSPTPVAVPAKPLVEALAPASANTVATPEPIDREKLDQEIIARAKAAKLSDLNKGMSEQPFGDWLQENFSTKAKISWEVNDCGENDNSKHQDTVPVCAEADISFPASEQIGIQVAVASQTLKTEAPPSFGPPGLFYIYFVDNNKKVCSPSLDGIAKWAKDTSQEPPCKPER